ncbi:MAG: InlB B-repeat-containing protein, partial [Streptococcaceae bacterium]|nr:InlB B-repeat-containing protein [Streptococcaceae bacterium]
NSGSEIKDEEVRYITANGQWGTKQPQTLYAHWQGEEPPATGTTKLTLKVNAGVSTDDREVTATKGFAELSTFTPHSYTGHTLIGYYTAGEDGVKIIEANGSLVANTTYTDGSSKWTSDLETLELFAHWVENNDTFNPEFNESGEVEIAGDTWRVIRNFYGGIYNSNENDFDTTKKLIIRVTKTDSPEPRNSFYASNSDETYFNAEPDDTGYGRSNLKATIDVYYDEYLAAYSSFIMPVNLDLPTFSKLASIGPTYFLENSGVSDWKWKTNGQPGWDDIAGKKFYGSYGYLDTRFKTLLTANKAGSLTDKKQAFALSYGDLNSLPLDDSGNWGSKAILASGISGDYYLRSPIEFNKAGVVIGTGAFSNQARELYAEWSAPVTVPALWISTRPIHNVTLDLNGATSGSTALTVTEDSKFIYGLENKDEMPKKDGFTFAGYFTSAEGGEQVIDDKGKLVKSSYTDTDVKWTNTSNEITLYAHWTADVQTAKKTAKLSR